jgi:multisubunit Na+/H+ antiporter MnhB subunit
MDAPEPDDIQARPPKRRSEEIQAHRPERRSEEIRASRPHPRSEDPPLRPYKSPRSWWPPDWVLLLVIFLLFLFVLVSFLGQVTNRTFSHTVG